MPIVDTNTDNVKKVNQDTNSMTSELHSMAQAAKSLEDNLKGVNSQLTAMSKMTGLSFKQMNYLSKSTKNFTEDLDKAAKKAEREREKQRKEEEKEREKQRKKEEKDRARSEKERARREKERKQDLKHGLSSIPGIGELLSPFGAAAAAATGALKLLTVSCKAAAQAAERLALSEKSLGATGEDLKTIRNSSTELKTTFDTLKTAIGTGLAPVIKGVSKGLEGLSNGLIWISAKLVRQSYAEAKATLNNQYVSTTKNGYITEAQQSYMMSGMGSYMSAAMAEEAYLAAINTARTTPGNQGLSEAQLLNTTAFKTYFDRYKSIGSSIDSNIFEGAASDVLGEDYIPGATRSKANAAAISKYIITQLGTAKSQAQISDMLKAWEKQGTINNALMKNIYPFDEVISNATVQTEDQDLSAGLADLTDVVENIEDNTKDVPDIPGAITNIDIPANPAPVVVVNPVPVTVTSPQPVVNVTVNPGVETVPAVETVPGIETVPAVETAPGIETVPAYQSSYAPNFNPATHPIAATQPATQTAPKNEALLQSVLFEASLASLIATFQNELAHSSTLRNTKGIENNLNTLLDIQDRLQNVDLTKLDAETMAGLFKTLENFAEITTDKSIMPYTNASGFGKIMTDIGSSIVQNEAVISAFTNSAALLATLPMLAAGGIAGLQGLAFPALAEMLQQIMESGAIPALAKTPKFALGGVGTQPVSGATLFENGPEAVIPLSSPEGVNYLAAAMKEAGGANGSNIHVTVELSGLNIADNDRQWNEVARNIGERINTIIRREGSV